MDTIELLNGEIFKHDEILELMKNVDQIENFNKKAIFLLVREMTGVRTSEITKILNVMRKHYPKLGKEFGKVGSIHNIL